jgi:hypothetical protein
MGRKSSAKKKRRIEKQEIQKPQKTKKTKKKLKIPQVPPQKIFGTLLAAIMLTILITVSTVLFKKAFSPVSLADLLPEKETVAFLEINTNLDHTQLVKAQTLLEGTEYSVQETMMQIEEKLSINISQDIKPWLGRQIGVAELLLSDLHSVYFLETTSKKKTEEFLKLFAENNLSELTTTEAGLHSFTLRHKGENRSLDQALYANFLEEYLIISPSKESIKLLIDSNSEKIANNDKYQEARSSAPVNKVGFIFMNFKHSPEILLQKYGVLTNSPLLSSAIQPFAELFNSEGLSLIAKDEYFVVDTFMNLNESYLKGNRYITYVENYDADLVGYIPEDADAFWGGEDLEKQTKRLVALLSEGNQATTQIFEGVLKNYTEKYFGSSVSLEEDIYPLVQNEFAIVLDKTEDENIYTLILELDDPTDDALKIQKIANNFISSGAVFEPHVEEHELPDGTIAKEIVATPEELVKSEDPHGETDVVVYQMETESKNWGVYYSIVDSKAIISTDKATLEKSLNLALNEAVNSIENSKIYNLHVDPILGNLDEVSYFDILSFWPDSKLVKSISTGKEYFSNGITAHYYIYVE